MLTGKYKRDAEAPEGSRLAWTKNTGKVTQASPNLDNYTQKDKFWSLIEKMEEAAKTHGEYLNMFQVQF